MPHLLGIQIKDFKCLKDITLGKLSNTKDEPLSNLTSLIGKNSSGKSSFFEVFSFISDCLKFGVEDACLVQGGLANLISKETVLVEQEDQINKTTTSSSTLIAETASSTLKSKSSPTDSASMSFEFCFKGRNDNELITYSLSVGYHQIRPENKEHAEKETKNNDAFKAISVSSFLEKPSQDLSSSYVRTTSPRASLARSPIETSTSARTTFSRSPLTTSTSATSTHSTTKLSTYVKPTSFSTLSSTSSKRPCVLHESIIKTAKDKVNGSKDYILMHFSCGKGVIFGELYNEIKADDFSISSEKVKQKVSIQTSVHDLNITANPDRCGIESERSIENESGIENVRDIGTDSLSRKYKEKYDKGDEVDPVSKSYGHIENLDVAESNQVHTVQCSKLEKTSSSNHHEGDDLHQEETASDCILNAAISNSAISNRTISNGEPVNLEVTGHENQIDESFKLANLVRRSSKIKSKRKLR